MSQILLLFFFSLRNGNHDIHSAILIDRNNENANFPPIWNAFWCAACKRIDDPNAINTMSIRFVFVWINPVENNNKAPYFHHKYTHPTWIRIVLFFLLLLFFSFRGKAKASDQLCALIYARAYRTKHIHTILLSVDYQRVTATCSAFVEFFTFFSITFFFGVLLSVRYFSKKKNLLSIVMEAEALSHWIEETGIYFSFHNEWITLLNTVRC